MEEKRIDKSQWGPGPWRDEPDRVEWRHKGVPCLMVRQEGHGAWCGYAAVSPGHPWHGKGYDDVPAEIHGGLTYADACRADICHVPAPGESDNVWWLGFDCVHGYDLMSRSTSVGDIMLYQQMGTMGGRYETYRDLIYVTSEVESLAEQILEAGK